MGLVTFIIINLVGKGTYASLSVHILVDASCRAVGEERLIIQVVVFLVTEPSTKTACLVEQSLIKHDILGGRLGLSKSDFL